MAVTTVLTPRQKVTFIVHAHADSKFALSTMKPDVFGSGASLPMQRARSQLRTIDQTVGSAQLERLCSSLAASIRSKRSACAFVRLTAKPTRSPLAPYVADHKPSTRLTLGALRTWMEEAPHRYPSPIVACWIFHRGFPNSAIQFFVRSEPICYPAARNIRA